MTAAPRRPPPYPIGLEEARADAARSRRSLARLHLKKAALAVQLANVEATIRSRETMLRVICGVYPELAEHTQTEVPR